MPHIEFIRADITRDRAALVELNIEYMSWAFEGLETQFQVSAQDAVGMPVADYVVSVIDKVCADAPPLGVFYLIEVDGQLAGMGGLRRLQDGVAELKRIYVRPAFRGLGLGAQMLQHLLGDAKAFGYTQACLDSAWFMSAAHRLYEQAGFVDCPAYAGTEVTAEFRDRWRFMARAL